MTVLSVLTFPDKRLRTKAIPVTVFDDALRIFVENMLETMYAQNGVGLAAIQVNTPQRVIVLDVSETRDAPRVFINPVITHKSGTVVWQEGCLSVPEFYADVTRAKTVTVQAYDENGKSYTETVHELFAICLQHEIDHLNGKLFIDYLPKEQRDALKAQYKFH